MNAKSRNLSTDNQLEALELSIEPATLNDDLSFEFGGFDEFQMREETKLARENQKRKNLSHKQSRYC